MDFPQSKMVIFQCKPRIYSVFDQFSVRTANLFGFGQFSSNSCKREFFRCPIFIALSNFHAMNIDQKPNKFAFARSPTKFTLATNRDKKPNQFTIKLTKNRINSRLRIKLPQFHSQFMFQVRWSSQVSKLVKNGKTLECKENWSNSNRFVFSMNSDKTE
jgi:hypothetical protein